MKTPIEPQTAFASEARRKYVNKETGKPENHDRAWAGEIRLPAGGRVWAAIVADGCGGDSRGTQVAEACVAAFRSAVAGSSAAELCDIARAKAWAARWGDALQAKIVDGPLKGGNSTLAAAVAVRDPSSPAAVSLLLVNVGDSPMFLYSGPELRALNVTPDEPEDNPNAGAGGNGLRRAIGLPATGAFPLFDVAIRRLPADAGPCGVAVFSDGVTDYTKVAVQGGRKTLRKLKLLNPSDFRRVLADGSPFADRAAAILAVSLATARARGIPETQMDNSSVALLGFGLDRKIRVPGVRPVDRRRSALFVAAAAAAFVAVGCLVAALWPRGPKEAEMGGGGAFVEDGRAPISQPLRTNAVHRTNLLPAPVPPSATNHPAAPAVTNEPAKPAPSLRGLPNEARVGESPSSVVQHSPPNVPTVPPSQANAPSPPVPPAPNATPVPPNATPDPPAPPNATPVPPAPPNVPPVPPAPTNAQPSKPAPSPVSRSVAAAKSAAAEVVSGKTSEGHIVNSTNQDLVVEGLGVNGEKVLPAGIQETVRLPDSDSIEFSVWPVKDRGCWNAVKGFVSKERPEFNIKDPPAAKPKPTWTAPPELCGQKVKVRRGPNGSWKYEEIPKDGKMEFEPHVTNVVVALRAAYTIATSHCGDDPRVQTNGIKKVDFPPFRFSNRGPRPVSVVFLNSTKATHDVSAGVTTNLPVAFSAVQERNEYELKYVVKDAFLESETKSVNIERVEDGEAAIDQKGKTPVDDKWFPEVSAETRTVLLNERKKVKNTFSLLQEYISDLVDKGNPKAEPNVRNVLNGDDGFEIVGEMSKSEKSANRYALLRWLYERIRVDKWFELDSSISEGLWDRIEEIWNEMADSAGGSDVPVVQKGSNEPAGPIVPDEDGKETLPSVPDGWEDYRIQNGDTLWTIAKKRLVPESSDREIQDLVGKINRANDIPDEKNLPIGHPIKVPPLPSLKDAAADTGTMPEGTSPD